jgi:DNA-binding response OmpR family regulator
LPVKILVIEDDKTVGEYVKRGLDEQRYHADLVSDGMEGLRLASGGLYDLLVLDLRLPGMTGIELVRTLRDRGNTTPILVLTAQDSVDFKVQALRAGADDYVTKPFSFEELLARRAELGFRPVLYVSSERDLECNLIGMFEAEVAAAATGEAVPPQTSLEALRRKLQ